MGFKKPIKYASILFSSRLKDYFNNTTTRMRKSHVENYLIFIYFFTIIQFIPSRINKKPRQCIKLETGPGENPLEIIR